MADSNLTSTLDSHEAASSFLDALLEWGRIRAAEFPFELFSPMEGASEPVTSPAFKKVVSEELGPVLAVIKFESQPFLELVDEREDVVSLLPIQRQLEVRFQNMD